MSAAIGGYRETDRKNQAVGVVEIELTCRGCGFNLRLQYMWPDEKLGLLICRCPECGGYEAVAPGSIAGHVWLRRVAQIALVIWVLLLPLTLYFMGSVFFSQQVDYLDWRQNDTSPWADFTSGVALWRCWLLFNALALGAVASTALSMMILNRNRRWSYGAALFPVIAAALALVRIKLWAGAAARGEDWRSIAALLEVGASQFIGVLLGAGFGRAIIRAIAHIILPAWALKTVGFLWLAEGKPIPAAAKPS